MCKCNNKPSSMNPSRKSRTKTRKPKFLSLRLQLSHEKTTQMNHHQLNLFPLHPDNFADKDENVADFFSTVDGSATTLTGLLGATATATTSSSSAEDNTLVLTYSHVPQTSGEGNSLLRTALRNRERNEAVEEEKWVSYSEVVERKDEEVSSCIHINQSLSLKLDYDQILNAWSDKGSLYIHHDSPQTVPDLRDTPNGVMQSWDSNGGCWTVPEMSGSNTSGSIKIKKEVQGGEEWKIMGQREASVLRYKEKRQNRLFSKKIRYEVRRLNAEKRPRIKGRFVKRN